MSDDRPSHRLIATDDTPLALFCAFADLCVDPHDFDAMRELRELVGMPSLPTYEGALLCQSLIVRGLEHELVRAGGGVEELAALVAQHRGLLSVSNARELVLERVAELAQKQEPDCWFQWLSTHIEERLARHLLTELWPQVLERWSEPLDAYHRGLVDAVLQARRLLTVGVFDVDERDAIAQWLRRAPIDDSINDDERFPLCYFCGDFLDGAYAFEFAELREQLCAGSDPESFWSLVIERVASLPLLTTTQPGVW